MIQNLYFRVNYTFHFFYKWNLNLAEKQTINLRYNDVKNLTSILTFCIGPKCVSSNNGT